MWWYVTLPYATFAVRVDHGHVAAAPPIAKWMIGMPWSACRRWIIGKGGHGTHLL